MIQISKRQYYALIFLTIIVFLFGYVKHKEVKSYQNYLTPYLLEMIGAIQSESSIASSILNRAMNEEEISSVQWRQLKGCFEIIEQNSYEVEKMGRAIYPSHAKSLENATKVSASSVLSKFNYIEEYFFEADVETMSLSEEVLDLLKPIHELAYGLDKASNNYFLTSDMIKKTYWVEMINEMHRHSMQYQQHFR